MVRRAAASLLLLLICGAIACASRREKGIAVTVVRDREAVRPCVFLGRLSATGTAEGEAEQEGSLRRKTAELGGNVLLLLPGGVGEAYSCKGRPFIFGEEPDRRPTAIRLAPAPTPTPEVWRSAGGWFSRAAMFSPRQTLAAPIPA